MVGLCYDGKNVGISHRQVLQNNHKHFIHFNIWQKRQIQMQVQMVQLENSMDSFFNS